MKMNRGGARAEKSWANALTLCFTSIVLCGCCSVKQIDSGQIDAARITSLQRQIKEQVGAYLFFAHQERAKREASPDAVCDNGKGVDFILDKVELDIETKLTDTTSADLKLVAPIAVSGISLGPTANAKSVAENDQQLRFVEFPLPDGYYKSFFDHPPQFDQLSTILVALHAGLLGARNQAPCFTAINYAGAAGAEANTYVIGLTLSDDMGGGVKIGVGPVSVDGSKDKQTMNSNKITVTFRQLDLDKVQLIDSNHKSVLPDKLRIFANEAPVSGLDITPGTPGSNQNNQNAGAATVKAQFILCQDDKHFLYYCPPSGNAHEPAPGTPKK